MRPLSQQTAPSRLPPPPDRLGERGHTIVELALGLLLFSIVMAAISTVIVGQARFYTLHTRMVDTRDAVRIAAHVLTRELREVSPAGRDLYAIAADSLAFRASRGFGVICDLVGNRIKLWLVMPGFGDSAHDSALVFLENSFDTRGDNRWRAFDVQEVRAGGPGLCPNGKAPELEIVVDGDLTGVTWGSPVRAFRPHVYRLYRGRDGRWWLGQRLRSGDLQPVAGPFAAPDADGLRFEYLTATGTPAAAPPDVSQIRIFIKGQSAGRLPLPGGSDFYVDTLATLVYLRNS